MGRKNIVYDFHAIDSGDMTQATVTGKESIVAQMDTVTYEFQWSGGQATNGDLSIEYSRDEKEPRVWKPLQFGVTINTDGASGTHQLIITEVGFKYTRPAYTQTNLSSTGIINCSVFATNRGA